MVSLMAGLKMEGTIALRGPKSQGPLYSICWQGVHKVRKKGKTHLVRAKSGNILASEPAPFIKYISNNSSIHTKYVTGF